MTNEFFKAVFQKTADGKTIMVAVVPDDFICEGLPTIYEAQAVKMAPTIYTGTYPNIRILTDTIKGREDLVGLGISGILLQEKWFNVSQEQEDQLGISL